MRRSAFLAAWLAVATAGALAAEGAASAKRLLPPPGTPLPEAEAAALTFELGELETKADDLASDPLLADAEIYLKAVRLALEFDEFYDHEKDTRKAEESLGKARGRLESLAYRKSPWTEERGFVVRGYRSAVDGSAQPYGLEIPDKLDLEGHPVPLYVWLHGRGDRNTDLHFIDDRGHKPWPFYEQLTDGIVLHPFGRQCLGYKSAGETDVLDAVDHVLANYNADPNRVALMGFSMGGAGAWHLAAHYPDRWAVAHAGAGFVDVRRYQNLTGESLPPAVEQRLWGNYDVPAYARNLLNLPVIAYSGEEDKQRDAAEFMSEVLLSHRMELPHTIGPGMGHKYHPDALVEIADFVREQLVMGKDRTPGEVHLQTRTLRYPAVAWVTATGLAEHWEDSRVDAAVTGSGVVEVKTSNITGLSISPPVGKARVEIDGTGIDTDFSVGSPIHFNRAPSGSWILGARPDGPAKRPGLQGPIDDAFLSAFLLVTPTGRSSQPAVDAWVNSEVDRLTTRWRATFRGDLRAKPDNAVTREDIQRFNLVLFGTPESNPLIAKFLDHSPVGWATGSGIALGDQTFSADHHALVMIYPNPAAADRYVVINSGPTFRESHNRTNSLQNPKLGDFAVVDLTEPPTGESPGRVVTQGFFGEKWELPTGQAD